MRNAGHHLGRRGPAEIDNCRIGVFAAYVTGSGRALVDRDPKP
ncbi:hypothetical protein AB0L12_30370 [Streptomyces cellulosae]